MLLQLYQGNLLYTLQLTSLPDKDKERDLLEARLKEHDESIKDLVATLGQFRGYTAILKTYFVNLQALSESDAPDSAALAVAELSASINHANRTLRETEKLALYAGDEQVPNFFISGAAVPGGDDKINLFISASQFTVNADGGMSASEANIGNWTVDSGSILQYDALNDATVKLDAAKKALVIQEGEFDAVTVGYGELSEITGNQLLQNERFEGLLTDGAFLEGFTHWTRSASPNMTIDLSGGPYFDNFIGTSWGIITQSIEPVEESASYRFDYILTGATSFTGVTQVIYGFFETMSLANTAGSHSIDIIATGSTTLDKFALRLDMTQPQIVGPFDKFNLYKVPNWYTSSYGKVWEWTPVTQSGWLSASIQPLESAAIEGAWSFRVYVPGEPTRTYEAGVS